MGLHRLYLQWLSWTPCFFWFSMPLQKWVNRNRVSEFNHAVYRDAYLIVGDTILGSYNFGSYMACTVYSIISSRYLLYWAWANLHNISALWQCAPFVPTPIQYTSLWFFALVNSVLYSNLWLIYPVVTRRAADVPCNVSTCCHCDIMWDCFSVLRLCYRVVGKPKEKKQLA